MSEESNYGEDFKKLGELIKDIQFAMLTTADEDGSLRSRPMGHVQDAFDGTLYYFTYGHSGKGFEIQEHKQVNVIYSQPDKQQYVSLSGTARLSRDRAKMEQLWSAPLKAWFPKGLDEPDIALIVVDVTKAEFWDSPPSAVAHAVGFIRTNLLGGKAQGGEDKKLDLETGVSTSMS